MTPPLPEKQAIGPHRNHVYAYTEAQLLAYRDACIEMCAKVCRSMIDDEIATGKVDHNEIAWTRVCAMTIEEMK